MRYVLVRGNRLHPPEARTEVVVIGKTMRCRWIIPAALALTILPAPLHGETFAVSALLTIQTPPHSPRTHAAVITAVRIHPSGTMAAAAGDDHVIRLWNLEDGSLVRRLTGHRDWIRAIASR